MALGAGQQHAVLHLLGRHAHQAQRMLVHAHHVARDVEHAGHLAAAVQDGRRRAAQHGVLREVVLAAQHHHRAALDQRGADGIGAAQALGPVHAGRERHALGLGQEFGAADLVQDQAARIAQDHHAAMARGVLGQAVQLGLGAGQQAHGLLAPLVEFAQRDGLQRMLLPGQVLAALPGTRDRRGHAVRRIQPLLEEQFARLRNGVRRIADFGHGVSVVQGLGRHRSRGPGARPVALCESACRFPWIARAAPRR